LALCIGFHHVSQHALAEAFANDIQQSLLYLAVESGAEHSSDDQARMKPAASAAGQ
jgi:hypothetical protein